MTVREAMKLYPGARDWIKGGLPSPELIAAAYHPDNLAAVNHNVRHSMAHMVDVVLVTLADAYVELMTPPPPPGTGLPDPELPEGA
jgi:hypothetical protein